MKRVDEQMCIRCGVDPDLFAEESRTINLALPAVSWAVLDEHAAMDDVPRELLLRHIFDQWVAERIRVASALVRLQPGEDAGAPVIKRRSRSRQQLYFVRGGADGAIKIGVSQDVSRRLTEIQTGHHEKLDVLLVVDQDEAINERELHRRFAKHRKTGEWFEPCSELLELRLRGCALSEAWT